ncbi:hypothetical protein [Arthrobacter sp. CG_A4]|uniref:hypothetical protein n=1 Tax=Arthrobacter sp. CG_A4 TaxID=3071706 RepID=UPI002E0A0B04|nr:hypothetical protein [Arthrobacter sp. CG_A4]
MAASAGERLFEQAATSWAGSAHGAELSRLTAEVREDKEALQEICEQLHSAMPGHKKPLAWIGAHLAAVDPLNPTHSPDGAAGQLELEALITAVTGKVLLWKTLIVLSSIYKSIDQGQIQRLLDRALGQIRDLEPLLLDTSTERLAPTTP